MPGRRGARPGDPARRRRPPRGARRALARAARRGAPCSRAATGAAGPDLAEVRGPGSRPAGARGRRGGRPLHADDRAAGRREDDARPAAARASCRRSRSTRRSPSRASTRSPGCSTPAVRSSRGGRSARPTTRSRPPAWSAAAALPRPGEVSLAHHGVLFLDEVCAFAPSALDALRQPLEEGRIDVDAGDGERPLPGAPAAGLRRATPAPAASTATPSAGASARPAAPRPTARGCRGPSLDRIDLHVEVPRLARDEVLDGAPSEPSAAVRARVGGGARRGRAARGQDRAERRARRRGGPAGGRPRRAAPAALLGRAVDRLGPLGPRPRPPAAGRAHRRRPRRRGARWRSTTWPRPSATACRSRTAGPRRGVTRLRDWPLGLARLAQALGRDLQRAARRAGGPAGAVAGRSRGARAGARPRRGGARDAAVAARRRFDATAERRAPGGRPGSSTSAPPTPATPRRLGRAPRPAVRPLRARPGRRGAGGHRRRPGRGDRGQPPRDRAGAGARPRAGRPPGRAGRRRRERPRARHRRRRPRGRPGRRAGSRSRCSAAASTCPTRAATARLARRIAETGALVSEYWPGTAPAPVAVPGAQPDRRRAGPGGGGRRGRPAVGGADHGRLRPGAGAAGARGAGVAGRAGVGGLQRAPARGRGAARGRRRRGRRARRRRLERRRSPRGWRRAGRPAAARSTTLLAARADGRRPAGARSWRRRRRRSPARSRCSRSRAWRCAGRPSASGRRRCAARSSRR